MKLIQNKVAGLLCDLLEATDRKLLVYLQAELYHYMGVLKLIRSNMVIKCVDDLQIVKVVNDYCEQPTENSKKEIEGLIEAIKRC